MADITRETGNQIIKTIMGIKTTEVAAVLRHIVGGGCIRTDPKKVEAAAKYPIPTTTKKVRQAVAFFAYYRIYIKDFAKIAEPLYDLLRKNVKFHWEEEQQTAFDKLKEILCSEPVLAASDLSQPFVVTCDASDYGLGAVIGQGKIGQDRQCAYTSRPLKGSELRYSTYDKELLAIVFAKEQFRHWLYGRKCSVVTDHEPLKHIGSTKKVDLRFNRLKAALRGYEFNVVYRPGRTNVNADALSRNLIIPEGEKNPELPRAQLYKLSSEQEYGNSDLDEKSPPARLFVIKANDENIITKLQNKKRPHPDSENSLTNIPRKRDKETNILFRKGEVLAVRNEEDTFFCAY
ncbi:hypothetical protein TSAR_010622 [Trichomalopsis sarcophagae]|uniref:RNA-directed DNA polymerase n=1 Tax=Trichomalopsis sarcophagae TaxID=543379 RepID=A0A232ER26_9HYME|nr:hypothetical protein TSAR_010622 [Trichomalopsis sarcophagae]